MSFFATAIRRNGQRILRLETLLPTTSLSTAPPGVFRIQTYNKLSPSGLEKFNPEHYNILDEANTPDTHAIMLRSHKLKEEEVPLTTRCIARCGAGTNNIPVDRMTALGVPVFNTPGANANAVKELVIAGLLLCSRDINGGINHMKSLGEQGVAREKVEKDKAMFGGREIKGKY
jgi:D-3-phosphoglycerate dehydrogenase